MGQEREMGRGREKRDKRAFTCDVALSLLATSPGIKAGGAERASPPLATNPGAESVPLQMKIETSHRTVNRDNGGCVLIMTMRAMRVR